MGAAQSGAFRWNSLARLAPSKRRPGLRTGGHNVKHYGKTRISGGRTIVQHKPSALIGLFYSVLFCAAVFGAVWLESLVN